jgi:hypothetical protein
MRPRRTDDQIVRDFLETSARFLLKKAGRAEAVRERSVDGVIERLSGRYCGAEPRV